MLIVKRIAGSALTLLAVVFLMVGFSNKGIEGSSQSILDSPEASGGMLGVMLPVVLFGAIGLWLLLSKKKTD